MNVIVLYCILHFLKLLACLPSWVLGLFVTPFLRIMVPPAAQLGDSSQREVSHIQSPPPSWTAWLLNRGVGIWIVDGSHPGLDLELGSCLGLLVPTFAHFPLGLSLVAQTVKASSCNVGDLGSVSGLGRSPGEGDGNSLQYCCLENPMDGGA